MDIGVLEYRAGTIGDIDELARLFAILGHASTVAELLSRWDSWSRSGNRILVAARHDGTLSGAVTFNFVWMLHRAAPVGRISALVVDEPTRGAGVGTTLVKLAENALSEAGCGFLEITTNVRRHNAHRFYEQLGYACTSLRFSKKL